MGRSSEGSGHSRTCTLDATNDASLAPGRARQARGDSLSGITAGMREATEAVARCQPLRRLRQACGKLPRPLHGVNHFVSPAQHSHAASQDGSVLWRLMHTKMCKNCTLLNTAVSAIQGLHKVP